MKVYDPRSFVAMAKDCYPSVPLMSFYEAVEYLEKSESISNGWTIRYYGFGEHLTYWPGNGTFIDFGIDSDTHITWAKLRDIIIESAMAKKEIDMQIQKMMDINKEDK